jgi:hypothetical protein
LAAESCGVCGGDGRLAQADGQSSRCPACLGSGRRSTDTGFHDVTKTKPSHYRQTNKAPTVEKQVWPTTAAGEALAIEIRDHKALSVDTKARLTREIIDHEATHGQCTQTFLKKLRKQIKPA